PGASGGRGSLPGPRVRPVAAWRSTARALRRVPDLPGRTLRCRWRSLPAAAGSRAGRPGIRRRLVAPRLLEALGRAVARADTDLDRHLERRQAREAVPADAALDHPRILGVFEPNLGHHDVAGEGMRLAGDGGIGDVV